MNKKMTEPSHEISALKGYHYLLTLWGENLKDDAVEYFAREALLMSVIEQQDKVNALSLTAEQKQEPQIQSLLSVIKQQLLLNTELTQRNVNSNKSGEF